jgi:hypothetical protein
VTATEATTVLRGLADAFPVPSPVWHAHVSELRACLADFAAAIAAIERDAAAAAALDRLIEAGRSPLERPDGAVGEALRRLDGLPCPEGEHPYVDEIVPTLEAMRFALAAVAASAPAAAAFAAR